VETYGQRFDPPLQIIDGAITVPGGRGSGIANPGEVLRDAAPVQESGTAPVPDTSG